MNTISSIKWLEADSKTFIQGKVNNMSVRVGFPEWVMDESSLVSYYPPRREWVCCGHIQM